MVLIFRSIRFPLIRILSDAEYASEFLCIWKFNYAGTGGGFAIPTDFIENLVLSAPKLFDSFLLVRLGKSTISNDRIFTFFNF